MWPGSRTLGQVLQYIFFCIFSYIFFIPEKRFLALGFGGQVNGRVSHCFPLNGNSRDPYCRGIEGVVDAYYESLRHGKYINIMPLKKLKAIQFQKWHEIWTLMNFPPNINILAGNTYNRCQDFMSVMSV